MSTNNLKILLADDDQEDLELIEEALLEVHPDAELHSVTNGKAAMDHLNELSDDELPCLIVLDYNMPEMNGAEVLTLLSSEERFKGIPRVVLSTSSAPTYMYESKKNGATEYFVKPDTRSELEALAHKMLALCA